MRALSVLFTNNALGPRGGSETYVRDVALALLRRGHRPSAFSLVHGGVAAELRRATVPVIDDITRLGAPPDVIHGHHHLETLIAALAFPEVPVVNFCHGWLPWEEMPLHHPSVRRYVAVDEACVDRLVREEGLAPERVELLLNFVDLARFTRRPPLPARPARALVLSNAARPAGYAAAIRAACDAAGVTLDIVGAAAGHPTDVPEELLLNYDLVFAKGRTALEALAAGCATILADAVGAGPLVTPDNYDRLRRRNFGIRELSHAHDRQWYGDQIAQYQAGRCAQVTDRIRVDADQEVAVARLLQIYATAMETPKGSGDASRAAAIHCSRIAGPLKQAYRLNQQVAGLDTELDAARRALDGIAESQRSGSASNAALALRCDEAIRETERQATENLALQARLDSLLADLACLHAEHRDLQARHLADTRAQEGCVKALRHAQAARQADARESAQQLAAAQQHVEALQREVAAFHRLPTLRLRNALLRTPLLGAAMQRMARRLGAGG
ncbi:MAG: glycosyltransferase family 4 protein [Vicinamibacterales bacterium]